MKDLTGVTVISRPARVPLDRCERGVDRASDANTALIGGADDNGDRGAAWVSRARSPYPGA
jgi:hypothetical protein